jgi:hypothetical protein
LQHSDVIHGSVSRVTYTYSVNETDHEEVKYYDAVTVDTTTGKARLGTGKDDIVGGVGWYIFAGLILFLSRILQAWVGPGDEPETPVHPQ